jgi:hypothetical protein
VLPGQVVASSNLLTPTDLQKPGTLIKQVVPGFFMLYTLSKSKLKRYDKRFRIGYPIPG